jgi:high-affinity Fe2+/Pb2+ permease
MQSTALQHSSGHKPLFSDSLSAKGGRSSHHLGVRSHRADGCAMPSVKSRSSLILVILAVLLSAFNGLLSVLSVMVFSGKEGALSWASIYLPAVLWIVAAFCYKFPRSGLLSFAVVVLISLALCVGLFSHAQVAVAQWQTCSYNLRFAVVGGMLLIVNLFLPRTSTP